MIVCGGCLQPLVKLRPPTCANCGQCERCGEFKPDADFRPAPAVGKREYVRSYCYTCHRERQLEKRKTQQLIATANKQD